MYFETTFKRLSNWSLEKFAIIVIELLRLWITCRHKTCFSGIFRIERRKFTAPSKKSPPHGAEIFLDGAGNLILLIRKKGKTGFVL